MIRAGFDVGTEPYLKSILLCLRAHLLQVTLTVTHSISIIIIPF